MICPRPDKTAYESKAAVLGAWRRIPKRRKRGVHPYPCRCGRWHLGRTRRRPFAVLGLARRTDA